MSNEVFTVEPIMFYLFCLGIALFLAGSIFIFIVNRQLQALIRRQKSMLQMVGSTDLEAVVDYLANRLEKVESKLDSIAQAYEVMAEDELTHIRTAVLHRFNAFDGQGGEQSFTVALLDARRHGAVVTSLYGNQENRIYAKPIKDGKSEIPLSTEEQRVLKEAIAR